MKALVFTGPGQVEVHDVEEPQAGPADVLVSVRAAGICGSELHGVLRPGFRRPPLIMGHEFAGITADGERVTVNPILACGRCDVCVAGLRHVCRERQIIGVHRPGGFAERVAVPRAALRPVPEGLSWDAAAVIEPAANAVHAWALAAPPAGARIAVIGAGTIGLACLLVAGQMGASVVHVADRAAQRREVAARVGATMTGPELTGEYDAIFDAVGAAQTREQSVRLLRPGGAAVWLGLAEDDGAFHAADLVRAEKRVLGSFAYTDQEFARAGELVGDWDLTWLESYSLSESAEIFTGLMRGSALPVKAVLRP